MGCIASTPQVSGKRPNRMIIDPFAELEEKPITPVQIPYSQLVVEISNSIMTGISRFPQVNGMLPMVCLKDNCIALSSAPLCLATGDLSGVWLPTSAISMKGMGRLVVISHIDILGLCNSTDAEGSAFIENVTRFAGGTSRDTYRVLIIGLPKSSGEQITKNMSGFDFSPEIVSEFNEEISPRKYHVVITTIEYKNVSQISNYLSNGGGVIIGGVTPVDFPMRELILDHGIGFPDCSLTMGDPDNPKTKLPAVKKTQSLHLSYLTKCFATSVTADSTSLAELDPLVTTIRYHITAARPYEHPEFEELATCVLQYLDETRGAYTEDMHSVCPQLSHSITFVLLSELLSKVRPEYFGGIDRSLPFPGAVGEVNLDVFNTTMTCECGGWFSTGLYLPPGVVATVTLEKEIPGCEIQIGAHNECILMKPVPWKRWATVTSHFALNSETIKIASPFGGIIYIVAEEFENDAGITFPITFSGVCRHPVYTVSEPSAWNETMDIPVPWSEIETQFVTFTVPTDVMTEIEDIGEQCKFIDSLMVSLLEFTNDCSLRVYRVVFDVELPDNIPYDNYPIYMSLKMINGILLTNTATPELFEFLRMVAERSMPAESFPDDARISFATLAAYNAFKQKWPAIDPLQFACEQLPDLWSKTLAIYEENSPDLIPKSIEQLRDEIQLAPNMTNTYKIFVKKMSALAHKKFNEILVGVTKTHVVSGHVLMTHSSQSLSDYQLAKDETSPLPS